MNVMIIVKLLLRKWRVMIWTNEFSTEYDPVASYCEENDIAISGYIHSGEFVVK
jgi:hypothetical protein